MDENDEVCPDCGKTHSAAKERAFNDLLMIGRAALEGRLGAFDVVHVDTKEERMALGVAVEGGVVMVALMMNNDHARQWLMPGMTQDQMQEIATTASGERIAVH